MAGKKSRKRQKENSKKKSSKTDAGENSSATEKKPKLEEDAEHSDKNEALEDHAVGIDKRYVPPFTRNQERTSTTKENSFPIEGKTRRSWNTTKKLEASGYAKQQVRDKEEKSFTDVVKENDKPFGCQRNKEDTSIKDMPVQIISTERCNLSSGKSSIKHDVSAVVRVILTEIIDVISSQRKEIQNVKPVSDKQESHVTEADITKNENCKIEMPIYSTSGTNAISKEIVNKCEKEHILTDEALKQETCEKIKNNCRVDIEFATSALEHVQSKHIGEGFVIGTILETTRLQRRIHDCGKDDVLTNVTLKTTQSQATGEDSMDETLRKANLKLDKSTIECEQGESTVNKVHTLSGVLVEDSSTVVTVQTPSSEKQNFAHGNVLASTPSRGEEKDSITGVKADVFPDNFTLETTQLEEKSGEDSAVNKTSVTTRLDKTIASLGKGGLFPHNLESDTIQLKQGGKECMSGERNEITRLKNTFFHGCENGDSIDTNIIVSQNTPSEVVEDFYSDLIPEKFRLRKIISGCGKGDTFPVEPSQPEESRKGSVTGTTLKASVNNKTIIDSDNGGLASDKVALRMTPSEEVADNSVMGTELGISQLEKDVNESSHSLVNTTGLETVTNFGNDLGLCGNCEKKTEKQCKSDDITSVESHDLEQDLEVDARTANTEVSHLCTSDVSYLFSGETLTLCKSENQHRHDQKVPSNEVSIALPEAAFLKENTNQKPTVNLEMDLRKSLSSCLDHQEKQCKSDDMTSEESHNLEQDLEVESVDSRTANTEVSHFCKSDVSCCLFSRETLTLCKPENPQGHDQKIASYEVSIALTAPMSDKQQDDCPSFGSVGDLLDDDYLMDCTDSQLAHLDSQNIKPNCVNKKSVNPSQSNATVEEITTQEETEHVADIVTDSGMIKGLISELSSLNAFIMGMWRDLETLKKHRHARLKSNRRKRLKLTGN